MSIFFTAVMMKKFEKKFRKFVGVSLEMRKIPKLYCSAEILNGKFRVLHITSINFIVSIFFFQVLMKLKIGNNSGIS